MRYSQITTSRLSKSASKLDMDGEWHPFHSTPLAWYRVWRKRLVQRSNFVDENEERIILPLLQSLEPLKRISGTMGFRDELNVILVDDRLEVVAALGYASDTLADLRSALSSLGISVSVDENIITARVPIEELTSEALSTARARLVEARLMFSQSLK